MKIIINQKEVSQERMSTGGSRESIKQLRYLIYRPNTDNTEILDQALWKQK